MKLEPDSSKTILLINISGKYAATNLDSAFLYANKAYNFAKTNQEKSDLVKAGLNLANRYSQLGQSKKSYKYLLEAKDLAHSIKDTALLARVYQYFGYHFSDKSEYDQAIEKFNKAIEFCKISKKNRIHASILNGLGIIYWERGNSEVALKKYLEAYDIFEELKDTNLQLVLLLNIANIYADESRNDVALEYYQKILDLAIKDKNLDSQAVVYNNIAILHQENKDYGKALEFFKKTLNIYNQIGNEAGEALAMNNIGENYFKTGNIREAIFYIDNSLAINRKLKLETEIVYNLESLSKVYLFTGKLQKAYDIINEGLQLCKKLKIKTMERSFLQLKSEYYYSTGNYKKAYKTHERFNKLKDSLIEASKSDKIAHLQMQFETEKKEKENEILRVKNELTQENLEKEKAFTNFLIVFFVITMSLLILVYFLYKSKTKVNQRINKINGMLEESNQKLKVTNATKDRFFSIIAHDLRSPFNSILGFSELIKSELKEGKNLNLIEEYNANINESSHSLFTLLENLLQWAKSQRGELEFNPVQFDLHHLVQSNLIIFKLKAADKAIKLSSDIAPHTEAYGDINMVSTILRNLISNALKFTEPNGDINISAEIQDEFVFLKVKDSGIGISKENQEKLFKLDCNYTTVGTADETGSGLGLILCKEFAERNGGDIWVESEENKGSEFILSLKIA
ncbi:tetratricopeptide repeat-containing sensor histidine kinase [Marinifilum sp. D714]|uniref:tetratricopeptide repeat-containing sensor histidine kinase n=1 Tax=Marinifilum sp. D714 TaxID=2937523 RepID=UPI0027D1B848|nr:tetratricopeptide repeat-containing sensor histidine kinase [Marinifilum sp. D714]MDQ2178628.1 tetratricopeptide repeat-containing sensor histidine kinase [Marinifilum sp. D714]